MNNPKTIRHLNEIDALNVLFRKGGMSRADLARVLGLNRSSIGNIIASLMSAGLVIEAPVVVKSSDERRTGRPGIDVRLSDEGAYFVGVEIGIDRLSAVVIDLLGRPVQHKVIVFDSTAFSTEVVIAKAAALAVSVFPTVDETRLGGVCVALPALIDRSGTARNAPMLGWLDVPVSRLFRDRLPFALEVLCENDANAFAIGASYHGDASLLGTTLFLHIENGVGGGIIIGSRLFRGAHGFAGEFGHLTVERAGRPARRGIAGELESLIGKDAVLASYEELGGSPDLDSFLAALARGEAGPRQVADAWADSLSYSLAQLVKVLDPDRVVLGGSVAPIFNYVDQRVLAYLDAVLIPGLPRPTVEVSVLGTEGAAFGAACVMHQRFFSIES